MSVLMPQAGWIDVDPTNDQLVNHRYVVVACGRDYSDVPPVSGVIYTEGHQAAAGSRRRRRAAGLASGRSRYRVAPMRAFSCDQCDQLVFFENSLCLRCGARLGFAPSSLTLVAVPAAKGTEAPRPTRTCANAGLAHCNWLLEPDEPEELCRSCRLTRTRPSDSDPDGLAAFAEAEAAKRRLLFQLLDLGLPVEAEGLTFDLLSSRSGPVVTGHREGLITIDLGESDDARREQRRAELGEPYRTLLGHFRHETGHFCWPMLVEHGDPEVLDRWRALFGDERADYAESLKRHYDAGPPPDWSRRHVSAYATTHPWEDWAETFAHYLHIRDTLQTAGAFGLFVAGPPEAADPTLMAAPVAAPRRPSFETLIADWLPLTYALNAVNRSMGRGDLYPFTLAAAVIEKLAFVHARVWALGGAGSPQPAATSSSTGAPSSSRPSRGAPSSSTVTDPPGQ
jgi:hypothetical protein